MNHGAAQSVKISVRLGGTSAIKGSADILGLYAEVFPLGILPKIMIQLLFVVLKGLKIITQDNKGLFLQQKIVTMKIIDSRHCGPILFTCLSWEYLLFLQLVCWLQVNQVSWTGQLSYQNTQLLLRVEPVNSSKQWYNRIHIYYMQLRFGWSRAELKSLLISFIIRKWKTHSLQIFARTKCKTCWYNVHISWVQSSWLVDQDQFRIDDCVLGTHLWPLNA